MTQEWLEMSFPIIPRNDRNDVGMMFRLIQCPFLSFLSFMIFLCHSFISASFRHSKLISEWWAMGKMRNDVEWMTKFDHFPCWGWENVKSPSLFWNKSKGFKLSLKDVFPHQVQQRYNRRLLFTEGFTNHPDWWPGMLNTYFHPTFSHYHDHHNQGMVHNG